nr:aldehyde dehydrogenase family protein [Rhizobium sp. FKY42]
MSSDACFLRSGPLSATPVTCAASATPADVEPAAVSAARAFGDWSRTTSTHRRKILRTAAGRLAETTDLWRRS